MRTTLVALAGILTAACTDAPSPLAPGRPLASFSDGAHNGGNPNFFFLPPMVPNPGPFSGVFDNTLSPVVDICALGGTGCIAHFTTDRGTTTTTQPGNSETVRVGAAHYIVNWHTAAFNLDPSKTYRICVSASATALGHADVAVVEAGAKLKNVDAGEFVPLRDGRTLPIKFRIEQGALSGVPDGACGTPT